MRTLGITSELRLRIIRVNIDGGNFRHGCIMGYSVLYITGCPCMGR